MKCEVDVLTPTQRRLRVEVPAEQVDQAFARIYREVGRRAKVRGFRSGKIPRSVLHGLYGAEVQTQALSRLVEESFAGAVRERGLEPVSEPRLEMGDLKQEQPFSFTAVVDVKPAIELKEYRNVPVERVRAEVGDEEVDRALAELRERSAQLEPVEDRVRVEEGDYVLVDFSGSVDGEPFPGSAAEGYPVDVGAGKALPDFERGLVGMERDAPGTLVVNLPDQVRAEGVAGKQAEFEVTVKDIRRKLLPPLDDEFARDYGECDSLPELREKLRSDMQRQVDAFQDRQLKDRIVGRLLEDYDFEPPQSMVDRELSYLAEGAKSRRDPSEGDAPEPTTEELREELRPQARNVVKSRLLIEKLAAAEGITASDEEVDRRVEALVRASGERAASVREHYREDWAREALRSQIASEKTMDFLLLAADVTMVDPPEKVDEGGKRG